MIEESIKCPICGTKNKMSSEICNMCKSRLTTEASGSIKVKSPKARPKTHVMIDIEDPLTRKKLEELTLIPGVTRRKALLLYQSGIHSIEEFMMKAFQGERFSANFSRTVSNKLLVQSLGKKNRKAADIPCPSCKAPNPATSKKCKVCNFDIEKDMNSVDISELTGKIDDSVQEMLVNLSKSEDFESLPEDMKEQLAALAASDDIDFETAKPKNMESFGIDLDSIDSEISPAEKDSEVLQQDGEEMPEAQKAATDIEETERGDVSVDSAPSVKGQTDAKKEKINRVLTEKIVKWRKAGYDVAPLEKYIDDVEGFKAKAKEVLGEGKIVKLRYMKQIEMWREKGFDVSELEPILETDVDLFPGKAKEILKKQKK